MIVIHCQVCYTFSQFSLKILNHLILFYFQSLIKLWLTYLLLDFLILFTLIGCYILCDNQFSLTRHC
jgi:hypothetical protein